MKEEFDPNRAYNRDAINKAQKVRVRLMDEEAINRGRKLEGLPEISDKKDFDRELKHNPHHKVYIDAYTGEKLKGGDNYEFEHIIPASEVHKMLKGTHTDAEIAEIANNSKNLRPVRKDINRHKGNRDLATILSDPEKVEKFGINKKYAEKTLKDASSSILSARRTNPILSSKSNSSNRNSNYTNTSKPSSTSNSANAPKMPIKLILIILAIIILVLLFLWVKNIFLFDAKDNQANELPTTELFSDQNSEFETRSVTEESTRLKLTFAEPLEDLTKSITDISEFNSIVKNQNIIPVIGSMFEYNSTDISTKGKEILQGFANEYRKVDIKNNVIIEGFTCTIGSTESNENLGKERAINLKAELKRLGIAENLIIIKPIGMQNFVSTNNGKNDLILNRRSNVTIIRAE